MSTDLTTHRLRELIRAALDRQMAASDAVAQREGTDTAAAIEELLRARTSASEREADALKWLVTNRYGLVPIEGGAWDVYSYDSESFAETLEGSAYSALSAIDAARAATKEPEQT